MGKPGALHKQMGIPEGQKIPEKKLKAAEAHGTPLEKKRANLADTLKHLDKG